MMLRTGLLCSFAVLMQVLAHAEDRPGRPDAASAGGPGQASARADAPPRADVAEAARKLIEQKMAMVQRAVAESRLASRVTGAEETDATRTFAEASGLLHAARAKLGESALHESEQLLDQAIWALVRALQLSPGADDDALRARYEEMDRTLMSLQGAFVETRSRLGIDPGRDEAQLAPSRELAARARAAATDARLTEAVALLERAQHDMLVRHQRLLGRDTVVYTLVFDKPEDEFSYELARSRDYQRLVPIALREVRPGPEDLARVEALRALGQRRLSEAVQAAANGRHDEAVRMLADATDQFRQALSVAGLDVPQELPPGDAAVGDSRVAR